MHVMQIMHNCTHAAMSSPPARPSRECVCVCPADLHDPNSDTAQLERIPTSEQHEGGAPAEGMTFSNKMETRQRFAAASSHTRPITPQQVHTRHIVTDGLLPYVHQN